MNPVRTFGLVMMMAALLMSSGMSADAADVDIFGITKLNPTKAQGREWFAQWDQPRSIDGYGFDPQDAQFRSSDGLLTIGGGIASERPATTRLYVMSRKPGDSKNENAAALWKNVELTIYVKAGEPTGQVDGRALTLSARSGEHHNDQQPCEGTSYHATLRFDGTCGFKKEIWHGGGSQGYTGLRPQPAPKLWDTIPRDRWIGMKFVCRNCDHDVHVRLQLHLDEHDRNQWRLVAEVTDRGDWKAKQANCDRPLDYIINEARPAVYFRTDRVPIEAKRFSVREIEALP